MAQAIDINADRAAWPAQCLLAARGKTAAVLLSVLAHNFNARLMRICRAIGFSTYLPAPFLTSAAKIAKSGAVVADMMMKDGVILKDATLYLSETHMEYDFRKLADSLKLSDADRLELFAALKRWVVADRRLDPTMDPKDPDAKRLVH